MDVFEALYTTRAMRRVSEDPIPDDVLKQMVDAGIRAPSGSNRQGWKFIVVTDPEIKNQLGDSYREAWNFYVKEFYGGTADMGASNVLDDEKAQQVVRISKSAAWLSENFHKVLNLSRLFMENQNTIFSVYSTCLNLFRFV